MRWLFLFVLFLNLAYIAWQTTRPVMQPYANVQPLKNVQPIVLLSELKQQAQVIAAAQIPSQQNNDAGMQQEERVQPEVKSEKQRLSTQIVKDEEVAEAVEVAAITSIRKSEQIKQPALPSVENKVVAEIKPLTTPDKLQEKPVMSMDGRYSSRSQEGGEVMSMDGRYSSRSQEGGEVMSMDGENFAGSQEGGTTQKESCFTLGPFRDLDKLRSLTREIKPYVVTTDFRGREEREQYLYWVYIEPEKSRKKAIAAGKRLKAKKINDFYVIREGEKIHGISLGRFRNKSSAYGLAKKVRKLGFDVIVEPVFKTYTVYWLDYQLADGVIMPETLFERYIQMENNGKVSRLKRVCGTEIDQ